MTSCQGHGTSLGYGQKLCEILFRSNMVERSFDLKTHFGYVCTVILIWHWVSQTCMTLGHGHFDNSVKYYPDPTWHWGVKALTLTLAMPSLCPWLWKYYLGSRSKHTLDLWTTVVWNIIQIQHSWNKTWSGNRFWLCGHYYLVLQYNILSKSWHTFTALGYKNCVKYYQDPTL